MVAPATPLIKTNLNALGLPTPPITPTKEANSTLPEETSCLSAVVSAAPLPPIPRKVNSKELSSKYNPHRDPIWSHRGVVRVYGGVGQEIQEGVDVMGRTVVIVLLDGFRQVALHCHNGDWHVYQPLGLGFPNATRNDYHWSGSKCVERGCSGDWTSPLHSTPVNQAQLRTTWSSKDRVFIPMGQGRIRDGANEDEFTFERAGRVFHLMRTAAHGWHLMDSSPPKHLAADHAQLDVVASRLHVYPVLAALLVDLCQIIDLKEAGHVQAGKLCTMTMNDLPDAISDIIYLTTTDDASLPLWRRALRYCIGYANGRVIAESAPYEPEDFEVIRKARDAETSTLVGSIDLFLLAFPLVFLLWFIEVPTLILLLVWTTIVFSSCIGLFFVLGPLRHRMFRQPGACGIVEREIYRVHNHLMGLENKSVTRPQAIPDYLGHVPYEARAERCCCRQ